MSKRVPCSPYKQVGGMVWFARMLDKIRLHAQGELPEDYIQWAGNGIDKNCLAYLRIDYQALKIKALSCSDDEEVFLWCMKAGRPLNEFDIKIFNYYMTRRGREDERSELVEQLKRENGLEDRDDIKTLFDFYEADEGRKPLQNAR